MAVPRNVARFTTLMTWALRIRHNVFGAVTYGVTFAAAVAATQVISAARWWFPITFTTAAATALAPFPSFTLAFAFPGSFAIESFASDKGSNLAIGHVCELLGREVGNGIVALIALPSTRILVNGLTPLIMSRANVVEDPLCRG